MHPEEDTSTAASSTVESAGHHVVAPAIPNLAHLSPSVRHQAARILARPETVQAEVEETMNRLRRRYRQLQEQLQARQEENSSHTSNTTIESLHNEELIALHVLHGGLGEDQDSITGKRKERSE